MKKIADAVFIEPAIFGFRMTDSGKLAPFTERLQKNESLQFRMLEMKMKAGQIVSADLSAGYVRLDVKDIPGELDRLLDSNNGVIIQFDNPNDMAEFSKNDKISIYQIEKDNKIFYKLKK